MQFLEFFQNLCEDFILPFCVIFGTPISIVVLVMYMRRYKIDKRAQVVQKCIENGTVIAPETLAELLGGKPKKTKKKSLFDCLYRGLIMIALGVPFFISGDMSNVCQLLTSALNGAMIFGLVLMSLGVAHVIIFFIGKRYYAKEIEQEQHNSPK